jgi:hypothetical protein
MKYAVIGKWNNKVQRVDLVSNNFTGIEDLYEIETDFAFPDPLVPDVYLYENSSFSNTTLSTMGNIDVNWKTLFSDYKVARVSMYIAMMMQGGFANLSLSDKIIASRWFIVGRLERNEVHTTEQQIANGLIYNDNSIEARNKRMTQCMIEVYNRVDDEAVKEIMATMDFSRTTYNYIKIGVEGKAAGDIADGIYDYILSTPGSSWETTGLSSQSYTPVGYANCGELANRLMDILMNGNY